MEIRQQNTSRKRFLLWSVVALGSATVLRFIKRPKTTKTETVKMLTPDGKLVEVDKSVIEKATGLKKASGKEVFEWMDQKHKT